VPYDILRDLVKEGKVGKIHDTFYSMPACTTVSKRCAEVGGEIAAKLKQRGTVDGVILTST
jgi:glycine reductase